MSPLKHRMLGTLAGLTLLTGTALAGFVGAAPAGASFSLNLLGTTTTLGASPAQIVSTYQPLNGFTPESTTLTASVELAPLGGLYVTPAGTVTFSATDYDGSVLQLGSAQLGTCLLTACTATLSTDAFYVDEPDLNSTSWTVTASYPGDLVAQPSSGKTTVTVLNGDTSDCNTDQECDLDVTNADGQANVFVDVPCTINPANCVSEEDTVRQSSVKKTEKENAIVHPGEGTDYTLSAAFGEPAFLSSCQTPGDNLDNNGVSVNAVINWPNAVVGLTNDNSAAITYSLNGPPADQQGQMTDPYDLCYGQETEFTTSSGSAAPFDAVLGFYEGEVPQCANNEGVAPCSANESYTNGADTDPVSTSIYNLTIYTDSDPGGGKH
jgi:hypothetical protein